MYTHQVVIIRQNTDHDFYYNVNGTLADPVYIDLANQAKAEGKMISEEMNLSDDGLILERKVVWDSEESFTNFFAEWKIQKPDYNTKFLEYNQSVDHTAMLVG
jgi:uncharacterized protein YueI